MQYQRILKLETNLGQLAPKKAAVIAACCAELLFPNYVNFVAETNWGDVYAVRDMLNISWQAIELDRYDSDLHEQIERCELLIPDTEQFDLPHATYALDAAMAVWNTLSCLQKADSKYAVSASRAVLGSIDLHLRRLAIFNKVPEDDVDTFVLTHSMMQSEVERQEQLVNRLKDGSFNLDDVYMIHKSCTTSKKVVFE